MNINIKEDHFMSASDEMVFHLAKEAFLSYKRQEKSIDLIRERTHKIISLLFAGIGGSVALYFNEAGKLYGMGLLILAFGWSMSSAWLMFFCLFGKERKTIYSSPERLYFDWSQKFGDDLTNLQIIKRLQLYDYSVSINSTSELARKIARNMNIWLCLAIFTAFVCLVYALLVF